MILILKSDLKRIKAAAKRSIETEAYSDEYTVPINSKYLISLIEALEDCKQALEDYNFALRDNSIAKAVLQKHFGDEK